MHANSTLKGQSTVAQWAEMTADKQFLICYMWACFLNGFLHYARTA